MKKLLYIGLISVCIGLIQGCAMLDKYFGNNDGEFDMPAIELILVDGSGGEYMVSYDPETGIAIAGQYTSAKTGLTYTVTPDGGFEVSDPLGNTFRLILQE